MLIFSNLVIKLLHENKMCNPSEKSDVEYDTPEDCGEYCSAAGKEWFFYFMELCYCVTDHNTCQLIDNDHYDVYEIQKNQGTFF